MKYELRGEIMTDDSGENKNVNGTKKCVIKHKLKSEEEINSKKK